MNNNPNDCSMALIVRSDLNLSIGKTAVQCSHAAVECTRLARKSYFVFLRDGAPMVQGK